jgi:capsular polysaccharide biosynthesis protein
MTTLFSKVRNRALCWLERRGPRIEDVCFRREILCPAEDAETPPGICDPRDFERVTACEKATTMDEELARMRGGTRHHGATVLYELEDAALWDGWFSSKGWRSWNALHPSDPPQSSGGQPVQIDRAVCGSTFVGSFYFGHWLSDDLPLLLEAEGHGNPVITTARTPYTHEPGYLELLGLESRPLIRAHFDRLIWIDNVAQNSRRAQQYRELRRRIRQQTAPTEGCRVEGRRVMLHRGRSGVHRVLANEDELEATLAKRGFEIVDPARCTARQIAEACAGARIALCVEGSQLTHAFLAMADHAAIVAMIPPYRYINHYKDLTDCIGTMRYGSITGTAVEDGFRIDPDELLHLLDRVETALDTR